MSAKEDQVKILWIVSHGKVPNVIGRVGIYTKSVGEYLVSTIQELSNAIAQISALGLGELASETALRAIELQMVALSDAATTTDPADRECFLECLPATITTPFDRYQEIFAGTLQVDNADPSNTEENMLVLSTHLQMNKHFF